MHSNSPGAPCCWFLKSQFFTLCLIDLIHGAVPQLAHQLQYNQDRMKHSGEELLLLPGTTALPAQHFPHFGVKSQHSLSVTLAPRSPG